MSDHEKRIREALEADEYLTTNVAKADLRALLTDLDRLRDNLDAMRADAQRYRAFFTSGLPVCFEGQEHYSKAEVIAARAALSEAKAGGWVAVPVEPTPEMLEAMVVGVWQRISERPNTRMGDAYAAMLAARPLPAPPAQKDPHMTTTPAMPEPFAWAWRNKVTGAKGVYFEDPKPFGITSHPDYEWTNLYTEAQPLATLQAQPAVVGVSDEQCKALTALFKDAMDWGRSYGQRINLSSITVADVSEAYSEKARAILALRAAHQPTKESQ